MKINKLIEEKRNSIIEIAKKHGAYNVRIFGSAARGEAGKKSDIDLLVTMEEDRSQLDLIALWQDLEELLGVKVDIITDGGVSPYLKDKIYAEAVSL